MFFSILNKNFSVLLKFVFNFFIYHGKILRRQVSFCIRLQLVSGKKFTFAVFYVGQLAHLLVTFFALFTQLGFK